MLKAIRVFGYPDIHWAVRDEAALAVAEAAQRRFRPDHVVIGGDLLDCGPFSRFPYRKVNEGRDYDLLQDELIPARAFLDRVQTNTRSAGRLTVLEGNHDAWLERWVANHPRPAGAFQSLLPSTYLMTGRRNAEYVPFATPAGRFGGSLLRLAPRLIVVHGWFQGKYAAEEHLRRARDTSVIFHHTHRAEWRTAELLDGTIVQAMSSGCLCKKAPVYSHGGAPLDWVHGFWVAFVGRKTHTIYPVLIHTNGSCVLPDGKEIKL